MTHRLIPEFILEKYRVGQYQGRFTAIGMFLDISGFSAITDALMQHGQVGSEALARLMCAVFDPMVHDIMAQGGMIVSFGGDALTALFPYEQDDARNAALHALTAARKITERLLQNPRFQTEYGEFPVSAKIGLSLGDVLWGILFSRSGHRVSCYFRGHAVEDSAQAEHHAKAGEILLGEAFVSILQDVLDVEPRDPYSLLKGLRAEPTAPAPIQLPPYDEKLMRLFEPSLTGQDIRSEFRQSVNLFLGLPNLSDQELRDLMYLVFDLQEKYSGLLGRIDFGDKGCTLILFWGAPVAYENDIGRAVNFFLNLRASVSYPITAGLTYYIANAGFIGSPLAEFYTCFGRGINLASRIMVQAEHGQMWTDERIWQRINKYFDMNEVGEFDFKGFSQKQKVYVLHGRKPEAERFFEGQMVGRAGEMEKLQAWLEPIWRNKFAGAVFISGETGVGKSRLVYEFRRSALFSSHPSQWVKCQPDQIFRESFNPFRYWLRRYFDLSTRHDDAIERRNFESRIQRLIDVTKNEELAEDLNVASSFLAALLDITWPDSLYEKLDARGRYENTRAALIALIKAESLIKPLILLIEDAHVVDDDSADFLAYLKRALLADERYSYPVAILLTGREAPAHKYSALDAVELPLGTLSAEMLAALAKNILEGPVSPELSELLNERADGNPFFAEQILRYLQEQQMLEMGPSGWKTLSTQKQLFLPSDINAVLIARLDQLTRRVREVVQTASVLGREFEITVLANMLQSDDSLSENIQDAEKSAIWLQLSQIRYIFKHALLRDAAYSMQMQSHQRELHALAVNALETVYADDLEPHLGELAYHAERGSLKEKALKYLELAGKDALDTYQLTQAQDYFTRALAIVPPDSLRKRCSLLLDRIHVYTWQGKQDLRLADIESLEKLMQVVGDESLKARAEKARIEYYFSNSRWADIVTLAEKIGPLRAQDNTDVFVDIAQRWSQALMRLGKFDEAIDINSSGRDAAERTGKLIEQSFLLNGLGLIFTERMAPGDRDEALAAYSRSLEISRQLNQHYYQAQTLNNLGNITAASGKYALARDYYRQSYELARQIGNRPGQGVVLGNLGWISGLLGDFRAAREYQLRALAISREVGNQYHVTYTLINLSAIAGYEQQAESALDYARQGLALAQLIKDQPGEAWATLFMGFGWLIAGDYAQAREAFRRSAAIREELGQPALRMEPLSGMAQVELAAGNLPAAAEIVETIMAHWASGGTLEGTEEPLRIFLTCYQVLSELKDPRALDVVKSGYQRLLESVSIVDDEQTRRMIIENVSWRRAIRDIWQQTVGNLPSA
jgi:predicted ATPase/class 3 adenylate cyclase